MQNMLNAIELTPNQFEVMLESNLLGFNQSWLNGASMTVLAPLGIRICTDITAKFTELRSKGFDVSVARVVAFEPDFIEQIQTRAQQITSQNPILLVDVVDAITHDNLYGLQQLMQNGLNTPEFPFKAVIYFGIPKLRPSIGAVLEDISTIYAVKLPNQCKEKPYGIAQAKGSEFYIDDALHIERIDELMLVEDDEQATQLAIQDGFCFISGVPGIPDNVYLHCLENYDILFPQKCY